MIYDPESFRDAMLEPLPDLDKKSDKVLSPMFRPVTLVAQMKADALTTVRSLPHGSHEVIIKQGGRSTLLKTTSGYDEDTLRIRQPPWHSKAVFKHEGGRTKLSPASARTRLCSLCFALTCQPFVTPRKSSVALVAYSSRSPEMTSVSRCDYFYINGS